MDINEWLSALVLCAIAFLVCNELALFDESNGLTQVWDWLVHNIASPIRDWIKS